MSRDLPAETRPHALRAAARCVFERLVPALPAEHRDEAKLVGRLLEALAAEAAGGDRHRFGIDRHGLG